MIFPMLYLSLICEMEWAGLVSALIPARLEMSEDLSSGRECLYSIVLDRMYLVVCGDGAVLSMGNLNDEMASNMPAFPITVVFP